MWFRGTNYGERNWSTEKKLEYDLTLHKELHEMYTLITKLAIVVLRKNLKLIIENPYSTTHYLYKYWAIPATIIDMNRKRNGDYYEKPTQYWFINIEPKNNYVNEKLESVEHVQIIDTHSKVERSLIHPQYARRFIKKYVIEYNAKEDNCEKELTLLDFL